MALRNPGAVAAVVGTRFLVSDESLAELILDRDDIQNAESRSA